MSSNTNRNTYESLSLTKKQFNLNRHLNSDNIKSILYYNDLNIPFHHYIQCTRCNDNHLVETNYTTNNLMSSMIKEQQYKGYCDDNAACPCNMIKLNIMKPNQSCYKAQCTNDSTSCCQPYYPLCNYHHHHHHEQMNNDRCEHCPCQCCIQSKWTSSMIPSGSSCFYCGKSHE